ncbi:unnamed protein product [Lactuca virosa]|uniref:DUF7787 domain-containing protein n=1 Tax=Lactuca virosa TaxID=75947 RepID=A0AAU9N4G5_9ASTR|nr:unnamed protein product [Lactuca virosa]
MESQGAAGKPWTPKLTLECYLNLNNLDSISSTTLRKIITMHGFNSIKVPKNDLMDAVGSIELMDAHHSTLENDFVSSDAYLSLNDVIEDLSDIHWQECCITSIQTINSTIDFSSKDIDDVAACSSIVIDNGNKKKKSKLTDKTPVLFTYARRGAK